MTISLAELGVQRYRAIECVEAGWATFTEVQPMSSIPPWYNAAERVLFLLAYGGYITHERDMEE